MKKWAIVKTIEAKTLQSALKKETEATIIEVRQILPEKDQLVSAIGFDATPPFEEEDY